MNDDEIEETPLWSASPLLSGVAVGLERWLGVRYVFLRFAEHEVPCWIAFRVCLNSDGHHDILPFQHALAKPLLFRLNLFHTVSDAEQKNDIRLGSD